MPRICVFGDSIVFGIEDPKNGGWVGRLKVYYEQRDRYNRVYNLGVTGETSEDLLKRFETECKPRDPDVIIIGIGTNDSRFVKGSGESEVSLEKFENNLYELTKLARESTPKIFFVGLTPVDETKTQPYDETTSFTNESLKKYDNIIKKFCEQRRIYFINQFHLWKESNYLKWLADGLHPNPEGHKRIFKTVKEFLVQKI